MKISQKQTTSHASSRTWERMRVRVYSTERACVFIYFADWIFSIFSKPRTLSLALSLEEKKSELACVSGRGGARALQNYGLNAPGGNYSSAFRKLNKNLLWSLWWKVMQGWRPRNLPKLIDSESKVPMHKRARWIASYWNCKISYTLWMNQFSGNVF